MKFIFFHVNLVFLVFLCCVNGWAKEGVVLKPDFMYLSYVNNNGSAPATTTTDTRTDIHITLGYRMNSGLFLGGQYYSANRDLNTEPGSDIKTSWTSYGPTIGYMADHFFVMGTYHFAPTSTSGTDASKTTYTGGSGYQVDIGYNFVLNESIGIAPQFTYYNVTYTKQSVNGVESTLPGTRKDTDIRPMLAFVFTF